MAKSSRASKGSRRSTSSKGTNDGATVRNSRTTVSGPAKPDASGRGDVARGEGRAPRRTVASAFAFNPNKAAEYDPDAALAPPRRRVGQAPRSDCGREHGQRTERIREGRKRRAEHRPESDRRSARSRPRRLDRPRAHDEPGRAGRATTRARSRPGLRGPTLLEDFILREKITHFDHERIPERIVHARGSAAHGYFECTKATHEFTRASLFAEVGKQTPVFVRFSTVLGERGSTDTARDVRGIRRQVLHGRGQLGSGRQQHPGVLHPGRDEVSRSGACGQARAALRDAAGRHRRTTRSGTSRR